VTAATPPRDAPDPGVAAGPADATAAVAHAARRLSAAPLPARAEAVARHCLLDWLGVALAGAGEPATAIVAAEAANTGGEATLVGRRERAAAPFAALVNGVAAHALDYDDMHLALPGHVTVPVASAVVALGERIGASGAGVLAGIVAGIEAECRIGLLVNPSHYARGWHATGTLGTFGAAAGCARLLDLDEAGWRRALGLAGTQAAGVNASFGTMAKPLNAGKAAMNGVLAAVLAAGGFTGSESILEAPRGFAAVAADDLEPASVLDAVAGRHLIEDTLFKYHAACYWTHASLEALRELREAHDLRPADVEAVELAVSQEALDVADIEQPRTGLEVKFSVRALAAMILAKADTGDPRAYADDRVLGGELSAVRERVRVRRSAGRSAVAAVAVVTTGDGRRLEARADLSRPESDLATQGARLGAKFDRLATPVLGEARTGALRAACEAVQDRASIAELTALAVPDDG
jgi:2-methylcitrate dehydratase PrpD